MGGTRVPKGRKHRCKRCSVTSASSALRCCQQRRVRPILHCLARPLAHGHVPSPHCGSECLEQTSCERRATWPSLALGYSRTCLYPALAPSLMLTLDTVQWIALGFAALAAGCVDAVVGGGGMIQLPAMFALAPQAWPAALLGTSKLASIAGTSGAAWHYARSRVPPWRIVLPATVIAFIAAAAGAWTVTHVPAEPLRLALPWVLLALLVYTAFSRAGTIHAPHPNRRRNAAVAGTGAGVIGFYDGFLGPGTGAFLKLLYVRGLGFDFLHAAAPAKLANVASNLAALLVFVWQGAVDWRLGVWMAACNFLGGQIGSRWALRRGSGFVRLCFLVVVSVLVVKTFWDAYF